MLRIVMRRLAADQLLPSEVNCSLAERDLRFIRVFSGEPGKLDMIPVCLVVGRYVMEKKENLRWIAFWTSYDGIVCCTRER